MLTYCVSDKMFLFCTLFKYGANKCKGEKESFGEEGNVFLVAGYTFRSSRESIFHTQTLENNKTFKVYFKPFGGCFPSAILEARLTQTALLLLRSRLNSAR